MFGVLLDMLVNGVILIIIVAEHGSAALTLISALIVTVPSDAISGKASLRNSRCKMDGS